MKALLIICLAGCITACNGQVKQGSTKAEDLTESVKSDSGKQMNLLDEQVKMYGSVFELAGAGENNPVSGADNYKELIEKMDLPQEQKDMISEQYKIYDLSLDPAKKDSLKIAVEKMLKSAMEKSKNDPND